MALIQLGDWLSFLGMRSLLVNTLTSLGYHLSRRKRRLSEINLAQSLGAELGDAQRRKIIKTSFRQFWLEAFSLPCPEAAAGEGVRIEVRGLHHLQAAIDNGKGAILFESNSFGRKFLAKQSLYQKGFSIHQIYGENHAGGFFSPCPASWIRRRIIKRLFDAWEKRYVAEILNLHLWEPLRVIRLLFERLQQNRIICVAGNGTLGWNGIRKQFLCTTRVFFTGMVSLSRLSGAPILPLFCVQESKSIIAVVIEPPIQANAVGDRDQALENCIDNYVSLLESYVKRHPEQYSGWHSPGTPEVTLICATRQAADTKDQINFASDRSTY
jgi:lauroyl/myristoyl acyltransferase